MRYKSHNNLLRYFIEPHHQLPQGYLNHCNKFFKELSSKQQATSGKPQALIQKNLHKPGTRVKNRFNRKV